MSRSSNAQTTAKDELCEKLENLALQKEKAEQHIIELECKIHTLGDKGKK
jgi:hypothetical protein